MRNQTSFRLTTTLLPTDTTAKTTEVINKVDSDGNKFFPTFTEETVVLTNDDRTIMETTRATCSNGVLTFVKRGLSDDNTETEIANRKLTRNPGSLCFITAGASDWIDIDDDLTWTGKQTYTQGLVSQGDATYKGLLITEKGVQYPSFADTTALEAYAHPFGGMFATVEDTGELYRYNAVTEEWDLVSTVELSEFIIREDTTVPSGAADNVITILKNLSRIYLGDDLVASSEKYADILLVGGGGAGGSAGGGGGGIYLGEKIGLKDKSAFSITIGAAGNNSDGGTTTMAGIGTVYGGGKATYPYGGESGNAGLKLNRCPGGSDDHTKTRAGFGGGGGVFGKGGNGVGSDNLSYTVGGDGGEGLISDISGSTQYYGRGGAGGTERYHDAHGTDGTTHTGYGVGGGIQGSAQGGVVIIRYPTDGSYGINSATGGTVTTSGGYKIHTFTENGTFTIVS